ncbi:MAG: DUF4302 domain-containing protein [Prevotella sp.]|jgi:hypothetical protein|nr:DUF4302 domain-containing protein [Prevotella sp.]
MKKIIYHILFIIPVLLMTAACVRDESDIFEKDAALRMDEVIKADIALLTGSTNGWLGYYYPEKEYDAGGYAMSWKFFSDGKVNMACDTEVNGVPAGEEVTSYWTIKPEQGPTLSFDLYNPILHYFCQPSNADLDGLGGDYEFIVLKATQDSIYLKGKKNGNLLLLYKAPSDDPLGYVRQSNAFIEESGSLFKTFDLKLNGETAATATITLTSAIRTITVDYKEDDADVSKKLSFVYTPTGIKLHEPFTFKGITVEEFIWNENALKYTSSDPGVNAEFVYNGSVLFSLELTGLQSAATSVSGTFTSHLYKTAQIVDQGVVYATTNDNLTVDGAPVKILEGTISGSYPFELTNLDIATLYYARAYVRTSDEVFYSDVIEFTTFIAYEDYLGDYTMHYSSATGTTTPNKTLDISLIEGTPGSTYYLKGILADESVGNIVVNYNPASSNLSFPINRICVTSQGYNFMWTTYSRGTGNGSTLGSFYVQSSLTSPMGMVSYDYDATGSFKLKYNETNVSYVTIGFILRNYNGGTSAGNVNGKDGQPMYFYPYFTKK